MCIVTVAMNIHQRHTKNMSHIQQSIKKFKNRSLQEELSECYSKRGLTSILYQNLTPQLFR